jgi:dihydroorotate dehydrogenase electron transfer subunit
VLGPIGQPFRPGSRTPRALLVGGGVGIPPMVFLAEWMSAQAAAVEAAGAHGLGDSVPVQGAAVDHSRAGIPAGSIAAMPLLDGWGVPSRLASKAGFPGCYDGFVTQLADEWLGSLDARRRPKSKCSAAARRRCSKPWRRWPAKHGVPCQVSLEEFMACAVGGCAGCTVKVNTPDGPR